MCVNLRLPREPHSQFMTLFKGLTRKLFPPPALLISATLKDGRREELDPDQNRGGEEERRLSVSHTLLHLLGRRREGSEGGRGGGGGGGVGGAPPKGELSL